MCRPKKKGEGFGFGFWGFYGFFLSNSSASKTPMIMMATIMPTDIGRK
jgi:hypothetical protein